MNHESWKRPVISIVLGCFAFVFVVGAIGMPRSASAQLAVTAPALEAIEVQREVKLNFGQALIASATVGLINAITLFGQQIAYDLAVGLASGCRGQNTCAFRDSFGTYLTSKLYAAAGEFVGTLAQPWAELGFDLCNPRLPDIALSIQLGLISEIQPPTPKCDFANTLNNWQNLVREVQDPNALLQHVSFGFDPSQTDLGQAFIAHEQFRIKLARDQKAADDERKEGQGIRAQISPISGNITTPSVVIKKNFENITEQGKNQTPEVGPIVGATLGSGQVWSAIGTTILSTFTNTLVSRMLKLALQGIFGPGLPYQPPDLRSLVGGSFRDPTQEGTAGLSSSAIGLISAGGAIRTPQGTFEYLTELNACPDDPRAASQFNCTIDDKFMLALQGDSTGRPLTVAQAMALENNLLDPAKPFGFVNPEQGREPDFTAGYPYSSMKKLRLLRVIPVGWEFAALKIKALGEPFTLKDVVDGWNATGPDGRCGTSDDTSQFCGLVDPNWVLKAPLAKCNALVFGERADLSGAGRQEACADLQHCVALDKDGSCRATGYCTREKNTWKLDGDACSGQYASCDTFRKGGTGQDGVRSQEVSLLENTVDFGVCSAENAGCTGYIRTQNRGADGQWQWDASAFGRLYLDQDAPVCDSASAGCTEFLPGETARFNILKNPGFEQDGDGIIGPDGWSVDVEGWFTDPLRALEGQRGFDLGGNGNSASQSAIPVTEGRQYTLSFFSRPGEAGGSGALLRMLLTLRDINEELTPITEATCPISVGSVSFAPQEPTGSRSRSYARYSCTFRAPDSAELGLLTVIPARGGAPVYVDALQLEESVTMSDYHEGYPAGITPIYYRIPPDYLGCTGESTDVTVTECGQYARLCRPEESGCERYTPTLGGDPIPGIKTALDECPQACVGYDTYIKQSSRFEPVFTEDELSSAWPTGRTEEQMYMIIPSRTAKCSAQEQGCDEFTNLRTEAREYYTDLRACQPPGADSKTYFTWEGSDERGYQLRSFNLKSSNRAYTADADHLRVEHNSGTGLPPCTNYAVSIDAVTQAITVTCTDSDINQAVCNPADPGLTLEERADCRAFYDESGNIFYRKLIQTIISTEQCQVYRWTGFPSGRLPEVPALEGESEGALRSALEEIACEKSHGFWNTNTLQCVYLGAPAASKSCRAQVSGCRGFKGDTAGNVRVAFLDTFPAGDVITERWTQTGGGTIVLSSEALRVGDKSLRVREAANNSTLSRALDGSGGEEGATYFVSLIVKGTLNSTVEVSLDGEVFGNLNLTPDWQFFDLGPVVASNIPAALNFKNVSRSTITYFIDEVRLRAIPEADMLYLVKHTWDIPAVCDQLPAVAGGGPLRGAMLGCNTYTDRAGGSSHLRSFSRLCRDESVGCSRLIDTLGTTSPFEETFNTGATAPAPEDDVAVGADRLRYVVVNPEVRPDIVCTEDKKGCQSLGTTPTDTVYRINDPSRYPAHLCTLEAAGCASWVRKDGSQTFFKDPEVAGTGFCEWKENVVIGTDTYSGWFKKDKQIIGPNVLSDTKEKCEGYGAWDAVLVKCIAPDGHTLCTQGSTSPRTLDGNLCEERYCTRGIGGTWNADYERADGTQGACFSDVPCYGALGLDIFTNPPRIVTVYRYLIGGTTFGIWRNADAAYQGRAGSCPKEEATCTEFVDPTDISPESPQGQPYYRKDNTGLSEARSNCKGLVSRKAGCVLFDNTENPQALFVSERSYDESELQGGAPVDPVTITTENDANTILQVVRDRECAEWLQCRSASLVYSQAEGKLKSVCSVLGRCAEVPLSVRKGGERTAECGRWILDTGAYLDDSAYVDRDRDFFGREYAGYSIPNLFPIDQLRERNFGTFDNPDWRLTYNRTDQPGGGNFLSDTSCTEASECSEGRACFFGKCTLPYASRLACRGYPERASPFPNIQPVRDSINFENAPKCQTDRGAVGSDWAVSHCGCNYEKVEYADGVRYYDQDEDELAPDFIRRNSVVGWQGYCLEEDTSPQAVLYDADPARYPAQRQACLTWWPVDVLRSTPDIYNQFAEAGYQIPETGGQYFCLEGSASPGAETGAMVRTIELLADPAFSPVVAHERSISAGRNEARILTIAVPESVEIYKYEIKSFLASISSYSDDFSRLEGVRTGGMINDPESGAIIDKVPAIYFVEAGTATPRDQQIDFTGFTAEALTRSSNFEAYNAIAASSQEWWWWAGDDNANENGENRAEEEALDGASLRRFVEQLQGYDLNDPNRLVECENNVIPWEDPNNDYDALAVMLRFDDQQRLTHLRLGYCSVGIGSFGETYYIRLQLKIHPFCTVVAQVDPKRSAPWTDRLWSRSTHRVGHVGPIDYQWGTRIVPFGSSSSHHPPPLAAESRPWFLNWNRMETDPDIRALSEFAGWPYTCGPPAFVPPTQAANYNESGTIVCRGSTFAGWSIDSFDGQSCDRDLPRGNRLVGPELFQDRSTELVSGTRICTEHGGSCQVPPRSSSICSVNSAIADEDGNPVTNGPAYPLSPEPPGPQADFGSWQSVTRGDDEGIGDDFSQLFARAFKGYEWRFADSTNPKRKPGVGNYFRYIGQCQGTSPEKRCFNGANADSIPDEISKSECERQGHQCVMPSPVSLQSTTYGNYWDIRDSAAVTDTDLPAVSAIRVEPQGGRVEGTDVIGTNGFLPVTMKFYGKADDDHMPLRGVSVDWDDGTVSGSSGLYRNHRPRCDGTDFGGQSGVSCEEKKFEYSTVYFCQKPVSGGTAGGPKWKAGTNCPIPEFRTQFGGCCVFVPAVQLRDNWGYCNGFALGDPGGDFALDQECAIEYDSSTFDFQPWTKYAGKVIVAPEQ